MESTSTEARKSASRAGVASAVLATLAFCLCAASGPIALRAGRQGADSVEFTSGSPVAQAIAAPAAGAMAGAASALGVLGLLAAAALACTLIGFTLGIIGARQTARSRAWGLRGIIASLVVLLAGLPVMYLSLILATGSH